MKHKNINGLEFSERKFHDKVVYKKNIVFDEKDLASGAKFQIITFKPGNSVKAHYHKKTKEIFYIEDGEGTLKLNNEEFRCRKGDIFLCEPGDRHEVINDSKDDFTFLVFKVNEEKDDIYWD